MRIRPFCSRRFAACVVAAALSLGAAAGLLAGPSGSPAGAGPAALGLEFLGRYASGDPDGGSEIVAYDAVSKHMFITNGADQALDIVDITNPVSPSLVTSVALGRDLQSVAVNNGLVAVAVSGAVKTDTGEVRFFDTDGATVGSPVAVGALPDMVTFTPDGTKVVVANEGEPDKYGTEDPDTEECTPGGTDPEGSVSIIDVTGAPTFSASTAGFAAFNASEAAMESEGVRIFGPNATVAEDLEPEYVAVTPDSSTGYVTLQENNALAIVDLNSATVTDIVALGVKDHSAAGNAIDSSDRDDGSNGPAVNIVNRPVKGMYMPDAINALTQGGSTYFVTANEGDARDYECFAEELRVGSGDYDLDATVFLDAGTLEGNAVLGRLTVTTQSGNTDADPEFEQIHAFGARSFTVWDESGALVYDSGDDLEQITSTFESPAGTKRFNMDWNADDGEGGPNGFDTRSDNKGPEPEASTVGKSFGKAFAFVALERPGGIAMFDMTNPAAPAFVEYENSTDYTGNYKSGTAGDVSPEGLTFVRAADSPTSVPLLLAAHELSGTTAIYEVTGPAFTPTATALDIAVHEPVEGSTVATVPIALDAGADLPGSKLRFKLKGVTAKAGKDFLPSKGRISLDPGDEEVEIPVIVLSDNKSEDDETFKVKLFQPKNLTLGDATSIVTIVDSD